LPATARGTRRRRSPGRTPPSGGRARPRSAPREVVCYSAASSSPPSVSLLLTCREVARVDDVDRIVVVEDEHDLERTAGWGARRPADSSGRCRGTGVRVRTAAPVGSKGLEETAAEFRGRSNDNRGRLS